MREVPPACSEAGKRRMGTRLVVPEAMGSAAAVYSAKRASPAQSSVASPARTAGVPWPRPSPSRESRGSRSASVRETVTTPVSTASDRRATQAIEQARRRRAPGTPGSTVSWVSGVEDGNAQSGPVIQVPPNSELTLGMRCLDKSEPGRTAWQMVADERFANPAGIVQGGFLGAMADTAMGSAAITLARAGGRSVIAANVEMKTSFLAPARVGSVLVCVATIVSGGERVAFAEAEITDDQGRKVARSSSTYLYSDRAPTQPPSAAPASGSL